MESQWRVAEKLGKLLRGRLKISWLVLQRTIKDLAIKFIFPVTHRC
jgi:hypothetical protein